MPFGALDHPDSPVISRHSTDQRNRRGCLPAVGIRIRSPGVVVERSWTSVILRLHHPQRQRRTGPDPLRSRRRRRTLRRCVTWTLRSPHPWRQDGNTNRPRGNAGRTFPDGEKSDAMPLVKPHGQRQTIYNPSVLTDNVKQTSAPVLQTVCTRSFLRGPMTVYGQPCLALSLNVQRRVITPLRRLRHATLVAHGHLRWLAVRAVKRYRPGFSAVVPGRRSTASRPAAKGSLVEDERACRTVTNRSVVWWGSS